MDIKILVATHKKYWMPEDKMYLPIHVGKRSGDGIGYIGDDTGENISKKNPTYCELTGLYWAWKNLQAEYIGLAHYRRHFTARPLIMRLFLGKKQCVLTAGEAERLLCHYDAILPKKRRYWIETIRSHYGHSHNHEDLVKAEQIIRQKYPEYIQAFETVMNRTSAHMFNMFVMKRPYFDKYCEWLFSVLEELEKVVDISGYNAYEARVFGFISEMLLDVWIEKHPLRYRECKVMFMERQHWPAKIGRFLMRKLGGGPFAKAAAKQTSP